MSQQYYFQSYDATPNAATPAGAMMTYDISNTLVDNQFSIPAGSVCGNAHNYTLFSEQNNILAEQESLLTIQNPVDSGETDGNATTANDRRSNSDKQRCK